MKSLLGLSLILVSIQALGSEVQYTRSQSSTSNGNKYKLGYKIDNQNKVSASYRDSADTSGVADDKSSTFKLSYRYKTEEKTTFIFDYKKTDEFYFYEGQEIDFKVGVPISIVKLNFGFDGANKNYTKLPGGEPLNKTTLSVGVDVDITDDFAVGIDYEHSNYNSSATLTKNALKGQSVSVSDISSYVATLYKNSVNMYLEYTYSIFTVGTSYATDTALITNEKSNTLTVYTDITIYDDWTLSIGYSRGRAENSTSVTTSSDFGLGYSF